MARRAKSLGMDYELHYSGRSRHTMEPHDQAALGEDTGNDILVNVGNHLGMLKTYIKSICRPLTQEEQEKVRGIINS